MIGEPLTPEAFDIRHRAFIGQEKLYGDMLSGDPQAQSSVISHILDEAGRAQQEGEVEGNPMVPFAQQFYSAVQKGNPEAYAAIRMQAAKDLVEELYNSAAESGNKSLFLSMGHAAKALGLPYKTEAEMQDFFAKGANQDPTAKLAAENAELKSQLMGRQAETRTEQFKSWQTTTTQAVTKSVANDAVIPALQDARQAGVWAKNQDAFDRLVTKPLNSAVAETIGKDARFLERVSLLDKQARTATSEQRRTAIRSEIQQLYVNRAKLAVEALRGPILKDAAATLKGQSDATNQRRAASQTQRAPASNGTPVKRSLVPNGMDFDTASPASLARSLEGLLR
jgi:hypothetical protein